jgi:phosphatidyl-myo-inositol alpha-mannosyltransferase
MRILHVTKKYPNALGGDATVVQNLEKQQVKNKNKVFILTTNCDEIIEKKNLIKFGLKDTPANLDNITLRRIFSLINLKLKFSKILKKIKPDVVHCHSIDMGYIISKTCKKNQIPIINHFHSGFFSFKEDDNLRSFLIKKILKNSNFNKLITINKKEFEKNKNQFNNLTFIPNGVNLIKLKHIKKEKNTLLFVGRIEEYKGLDYLLYSIPLIKNKFTNVTLKIIGDGSHLNTLKNLCKELDIEKNVKFLGKLPHNKLPQEYQKSSIFILPSYTSSETFGLVLLESLACKTPVITTNIVGISEEIKNKNCGIVIKPKNSQELTKAITKILKNPKLAKKMGENGRKMIEEKYNWEEINKDLEKIYEEILR